MSVEQKMEKEIEERVKEVFPKLMKKLEQRHPELIPIYKMRYEYVTGPYPEAMKLHNAYEILRTYTILARE